jgi:iron-sulfur cluster assembly protein
MTTATPRPRPKAITLTDAAAERVRAIMQRSDEGVIGLRIGVKNGGCAGMEYTMEWAREARPFEELVEEKGATILIDPRAVLFLLGTEMDYEVTPLKSGFTFRNPNQTAACGCGESVQLTPARAEM